MEHGQVYAACAHKTYLYAFVLKSEHDFYFAFLKTNAFFRRFESKSQRIGPDSPSTHGGCCSLCCRAFANPIRDCIGRLVLKSEQGNGGNGSDATVRHAAAGILSALKRARQVARRRIRRVAGPCAQSRGFAEQHAIADERSCEGERQG